jgi:SAM-dependent methyltransferase
VGIVATCTSCGTPSLLTVLDLGMQPASGHYPALSELRSADPRWPLRAGVCTTCWLVQLQDDGPDEIDMAGAPAPTSSVTMSAHARGFVAELVARDLARPGARVLECASHGGYLQPFFREAGIDTTVCEPDSERAARLAATGGRVVGETITSLGSSLATRGKGDAEGWDLIVDHYLLAHLGDPQATIGALAQLLAPDGSLVIEFDHLLPTLEGRQFDAIRHGHRSYLSLGWLAAAMGQHGLEAIDARPQAVYGGALRVEARRARRAGMGGARSVAAVLAAEAAAGLGSPATSSGPGAMPAPTCVRASRPECGSSPTAHRLGRRRC